MWKAVRLVAKEGIRKGELKGVNRASYSSSADSDYLHRSVVPTDHFQPSLPRLPVPKLEETCQRYLNSQRALLTDQEFQETEKIVKDFQDGVGKDLHTELVAQDKANKHTSYISAPWYDMYLKDRRPVVLNHNPFMAFNDDVKTEYNAQDIKATNFIVAALKFAKTLRANILEPEVYHLDPSKSDNDSFRNFVRWLPKSISWYGAYWYKAFPLDMSQFPRLYNGTRIPRKDKDEIFTDDSGRHMLVMRNGHFYTFDAYDKDGNMKSTEEILANIRYIFNDPTPPAEHPLGVLTTENRDTWADVRVKLEQAGNTEQMSLIDNALFALCLDDSSSDDPITVARNFLHSDGKNRWFDKSFSILIQKDGKATVNFEHSWGDGVAVLRMMNEVYKFSTETPSCHPDTQPASVDAASNVNRLEFNLTDDIKQSIKSAGTKFDSTVSGLDMNYMRIEGTGKHYIKKHKLSPDSFMQLAIQMAYWRQKRQSVATYESCSTSAFKHGRTETIRPLTLATKKACQLFDQPDVSASELLAAMSECSKVHGQLTKEAAMGQGFDRHLFAMKYNAAKRGEIPMMFQDPNYAKINHIILSTSTLVSPAVSMGGFGAVVKDGYGVGYACDSDQIGFIVSAYKDHLNLSEFLDCANGSVKDMLGVLEGKPIRK